MSLKLIVGSRNYSSWSLRAHLAISAIGVPFEEIGVPYNQPETKDVIRSYSQGGRTVPILIDGDVNIWESLAILEYLAEKFPDAGLWPREPSARALARSISCEMLASFHALRGAAPMNLRRPVKALDVGPSVLGDLERISTIWNETRARYSNGGPFLFGSFTNADAMYAPVATRIRTYELPVGPEALAYVDAIHALPAFQPWLEEAKIEPWILAHEEV